jgi:predicted DNA-binding transcriptional regulator AlpA
MTAALSHTRPVPRRGLSRNEAAQYIGVGVTLFDRMVADGRMPKPWHFDGRKVWDIVAIDLALDSLPREDIDQQSSWVDSE